MLLRSFSIIAALSGLLMIGIALFCWLYGLSARPHVVQAVNLMCQETDIWGCKAGTADADRRLAANADFGLRQVDAGHTEALPRRLFDEFIAQADDRGAPPRRLATSIAKVVVNFRDRLDREPGSLCSRIQELCEEPLGFDSNTACVCSGQFDVAPAPRGLTEERRLQDGHATGGDPWQGTIGDYCKAWTSTEPEEDEKGDWCFVAPLQTCRMNAQTPYQTSKSSVRFMRSRGPCTSSVESRSKVIIVGMRSLFFVLELASLLGLLLVCTSCCGVWLYQAPSKPATSAWADVNSRIPDYKDPMTDPLPQQPTPEEFAEMRFEQAQKEAVQKLSQQTPEELKLMLYGYYKQAKEGDVRGERPGFWNTKERAKYDYWARHEGLSRVEAIEGYVRTVALLP